MTQKEKRRFVSDLIASVRKDLLAGLPKIPEAWDEAELRQWIADRFQKCMYYDRLSRSDKRAYKNTVATLNL